MPTAAWAYVVTAVPPPTVVRMTADGHADTESADIQNFTHTAVRMRKTRFRNAPCHGARERRIGPPEQLHTTTGTRHRTRRGAA
ncbi:hypothetical protein ACWHLZ_30885 [Streptomyces chartreusis]